MELAGKVAVVTGAASGIGRAIALRLARDGADVGILDLDGPGGEHVAEEVCSFGRRSITVVADVADSASVDAATRTVRETLGSPAILVNNAGYGQVVPVLSMTESDWDRMIAVHLKGTFLLSRVLVGSMVEAGWGRVVNIASVAGLGGAAGFAHYAAAKAGMIGFAKSLAQEVAAAGVTVNAVAPGMIDTPAARKGLVDEAMLAAMVERTPVRRMGRPEEIAAACAYLVSEEASFVTGQVLSPNGGGYL